MSKRKEDYQLARRDAIGVGAFVSAIVFICLYFGVSPLAWGEISKDLPFIVELVISAILGAITSYLILRYLKKQ